MERKDIITTGDLLRAKEEAESSRDERLTLEVPGLPHTSPWYVQQSLIAALPAVAAAYYLGWRGAAAWAAVYACGRFAVREERKAKTDSEHSIVPLGAAGLACAAVVLLTAATAWEEKFNPRETITFLARNQAANEVLQNKGLNTATSCVPYFAPGPWGSKGKQLGKVCATISDVHRDAADAFHGLVTIDGEKSHSEMFIRNGSHVPGYEHAITLSAPTPG